MELPTRRSGEHILVVDDDPALVGLMKRTLEELGHEVLVAFSGAQALDLARQQPFSMIVMDVMMPYLDGFQVLDTMRQQSVAVGTSILFLMARGADGAPVQYEDPEAGIYALEKPFTPETLRASVRRIMETRRTPLQPTNPRRLNCPEVRLR